MLLKSMIEFNKICQMVPEDWIAPDGTFVHQYFKTTFNCPYKPFCPLPVTLLGYNKSTRCWKIRVLSDGRELDFLPLNYPLIPITEEDALQLIEHVRGANLESFKPRTEREPMTRLPVTPVPTPATPSAPTPKPAPTKQPSPAPEIPEGERKPSGRQLILRDLEAGVPKEDTIAKLVAMNPNRPIQNIKSHYSLTRSNWKSARKGQE